MLNFESMMSSAKSAGMSALEHSKSYYGATSTATKIAMGVGAGAVGVGAATSGNHPGGGAALMGAGAVGIGAAAYFHNPEGMAGLAKSVIEKGKRFGSSEASHSSDPWAVPDSVREARKAATQPRSQYRPSPKTATQSAKYHANPFTVDSVIDSLRAKGLF